MCLSLCTKIIVREHAINASTTLTQKETSLHFIIAFTTIFLEIRYDMACSKYVYKDGQIRLSVLHRLHELAPRPEASKRWDHET